MSIATADHSATEEEIEQSRMGLSGGRGFGNNGCLLSRILGARTT